MNNESRHWLIENLKTGRNLIDTSLILIELNKDYLLPTQLEYLFELCQSIIDQHCIVRDEPAQD